MIFFKLKNRICILSKNRRFLQSVKTAVEELVENEEFDVQSKLIQRSPQDNCGKEFIFGLYSIMNLKKLSHY